MRELETRLTKCENLLEQFSALQLEIERFDPIATSSELVNFEDLYFSAHAEIKHFLDNHLQLDQTTSSINQIGNNTNIKLPTIDLPKFLGTYERWLEFKEFFSFLIH